MTLNTGTYNLKAAKKPNNTAIQCFAANTCFTFTIVYCFYTISFKNTSSTCNNMSVQYWLHRGRGLYHDSFTLQIV